MINFNNISDEESYKVLDFLNKANSEEEIVDVCQLPIESLYSMGDKGRVKQFPISSLLTMAVGILEKRKGLANQIFRSIHELSNIDGLDQEKFDVLTSSISGSIMELEGSDIGNLEKVLRNYYLSQIKSLDGWRNRKQARILLEEHLVLPESHQRTSKDGAYIKEKLQMEGFLLDKLEDTRLIRKISNREKNPIYELSHDSLVEPILAERRNKETLALFFKRNWIFVLLLLLLFTIGGGIIAYILNPNTHENIYIELKNYPFPIDQSSLSVQKNGTYLKIPRSIPAQSDSPHKIRYSFEKDTSQYENINAFFKGNINLEVHDPSTVRKILYPSLGSNIDTLFINIKNNTYRTSYSKPEKPLNSLISMKSLFPEIVLGSATAFINQANIKVIIDPITLPTSKPEVRFVRAPCPEYEPVDEVMMRTSDGDPIMFHKDLNTPTLYKKKARLDYSLGKQGNYHVVLEGYTLYGISDYYNISKGQIRSLNGLKSDKLYVGQVLKISN